MNLLTKQSNQISMTSQEIADLLNIRHDSVKRSIERLVEKGIIQLPPMVKVDNNQSLSPNSKQGVYVFSGEQGKRDTYVVVAQLSPEFTGALVDRWQELESQQGQITLPDFTDPVQAARAWADAMERQQLAIAQVAELQPKAQALEVISHSTGSLGIRESAKAVGMGQNEFVAWCIDKNKPVTSRFMYRDDAGVLHAYSHRIDAGMMTEKLNTFVGGDGRDRSAPRVKFTPKGITHIAKMLKSKEVA